MLAKKVTALLVSAALVLALLAGCGEGQQSVARTLLNLLDGKYTNVSVEMDSELEADLRQVLRENEADDLAAIRAALETLLGSTVSFRYLGDGQQGDTTFDLVFYAGADPDKAAQTAYTQWNSTFSTLPDDGQYTARLALVQTENGCFALVKATVDKAGTPDKPDPEPEKPKDPYTQNTDGSYCSNLATGGNKDSSITAIMAYYYIVCAKYFSKEDYKGIAEKSVYYLMSVTRRNGIIDFSQGDTKGIGNYSICYDQMPFTQGIAYRAYQLLKE